MVEILAYYLIAAISFAFMYLIRYSFYIVKAVDVAAVLLEVEEVEFSRATYYFVTVPFVAVMFPRVLYDVITKNREELIVEGVNAVLDEFYYN